MIVRETANRNGRKEYSEYSRFLTNFFPETRVSNLDPDYRLRGAPTGRMRRHPYRDHNTRRSTATNSMTFFRTSV